MLLRVNISTPGGHRGASRVVHVLPRCVRLQVVGCQGGQEVVLHDRRLVSVNGRLYSGTRRRTVGRALKPRREPRKTGMLPVHMVARCLSCSLRLSSLSAPLVPLTEVRTRLRERVASELSCSSPPPAPPQPGLAHEDPIYWPTGWTANMAKMQRNGSVCRRRLTGKGSRPASTCQAS